MLIGILLASPPFAFKPYISAPILAAAVLYASFHPSSLVSHLLSLLLHITYSLCARLLFNSIDQFVLPRFQPLPLRRLSKMKAWHCALHLQLYIANVWAHVQAGLGCAFFSRCVTYAEAEAETG